MMEKAPFYVKSLNRMPILVVRASPFAGIRGNGQHHRRPSARGGTGMISVRWS